MQFRFVSIVRLLADSRIIIIQYKRFSDS